MLPQSSERSWASTHRGKFKRQRAILDAARAIIIEAGVAGLKMRDVAMQAGVSIATPYNLFGSKIAIVQAIFEEETIAFNECLNEEASSDALVRLFQLIDFTFSYYERAPGFYKQLIGLFYQDPESGTAMRASKPQLSYTRDLLAEARANNDLLVDTPIDVISSFYTRTLISICQEWLEGDIALEQARYELRAGLAQLLNAFVTERAEDKFKLASFGCGTPGTASTSC